MEYRCQGVGTRLCLEVIRSAKRSGYKILRLLSTDTNEEALGLYHKMGFKLVDKRPFPGPLPLMHHLHGVIDLIYELDLQSSQFKLGDYKISQVN